MKVKIEDVLFVAPEQRKFVKRDTGEVRTWWVARFVDDKTDFSDLELTIPDEDLGKLPAPRSRVDVHFDLVKTNGKEYKQNPKVELSKSKSA
ncbi:hypothetical protein [Brevibacillus sp. SYSU BS000544]|uniref:hypothetical protein n=1 Tax=Brevibacillus sp. SYSU BS000544 TaxID=3416443 RepID=UPI003CE5484F